MEEKVFCVVWDDERIFTIVSMSIVEDADDIVTVGTMEFCKDFIAKRLNKDERNFNKRRNKRNN